MEVFAGLGVEEMLGLTAVAGVMVKGTAVLTFFLNELGANEGECQLLLLFASTGDEVAAGAMLGESVWQQVGRLQVRAVTGEVVRGLAMFV